MASEGRSPIGPGAQDKSAVAGATRPYLGRMSDAGTIEILNHECRYERVSPEQTRCAACGMTTLHPREYHPYGACLIYRACRDSNTTRAQIAAIVEDARRHPLTLF